MALKIIGFLVKVIKLAIDTFVEKPVKVRRRVDFPKPNKNLLLVSGLIVGVAAVALLLRWFLKPLPVGLAPAKKALPTRSRVDATVEVQSPDEGSSSGSNGTQPEDLTLISGIGPKTANLLVSEGITTFQLLAEKSEEDLTELLRKSGFRIVNPATWPKQASLAAAGDWDGLKNYLEDLKQKPA